MKKKAKKKQFDSFPASSPIFLRRSQFTPFVRVGGGGGGGRWRGVLIIGTVVSTPATLSLNLCHWERSDSVQSRLCWHLQPDFILRQLRDENSVTLILPNLAWLRLYLTHTGDCISTDNQIRTIMWFILLHQKCWHDCCLQFSTWQYLVCFVYCLKNKQKCITQVKQLEAKRRVFKPDDTRLRVFWMAWKIISDIL